MTEQQEKSGKKFYTVRVHTGKQFLAGTDANVSIILHGASKVSEEIALNRENLIGDYNPFETGHSGEKADEFQIETEDVGYLWKIDIGHDSSKMCPAWFLQKVEIDDGAKKHTFLYNNWIPDRNKEDRILLETEEIPICGVQPLITPEKQAEHKVSKFYQNLDDASENPIIVRRGLHLDIVVKLARDYESDKDVFFFTLTTGKKPREAMGTKVTVQEVLQKDLKEKQSKGEWCYTIVNNDEPKDVLVRIWIPPNAIVGRYDVVIESVDDQSQYAIQGRVYILFNPWCQDDEVFMNDDDMRREYVVKQSGAVYRGSHRKILKKDWAFNQFDDSALQVAVMLLDRIADKDRKSAVSVSRKMTSWINSQDNNGILEGNWSGNYEDGLNPSNWSGSNGILQMYLETGEPVKYGQCWVFSGLVVTLMRCLGVPCRSITNYNSAHDTNNNCTRDVYLNEKGEKTSGDSIWNFHVWNDVYMMRRDLDEGGKFDGWQAIDATPQEASGGLYQMGPCPVVAVKEGLINVGNDTAFVFGEVNANSAIWMLNPTTKENEIVKYQTDAVGLAMCTKAIGKDEANTNVINEYKYPEGKSMEMEIVRKAMINADRENARKVFEALEKNVEVKVSANKESFYVGEDIMLSVQIKNKTKHDEEIPVTLNGKIVRYDESIIKALSSKTPRVFVRAMDEKNVKIKVPASDYMKYLKDEATLVFTSHAVLSQGASRFTSFEEGAFDIVKPEVEISGSDEISLNKEVELSIPFKNPTDKTLTRVRMHVTGTVVKKGYFVELPDCKPNDSTEFKFKVTPQKTGGKKLYVTIDSEQLGGVCGYKKFKVVE